MFAGIELGSTEPKRNESHAALVAELVCLRASQRELADLVGTVALALKRKCVSGLDQTWVSEAYAALSKVRS
jgi:hypothetical protein